MTSLLLSYSRSEDDPAVIGEANAWLSAAGHHELAPTWILKNCWSGSGSLAGPLHAGALNHLVLADFVHSLSAIRWHVPEAVQVIVCGPHDYFWRILQPFAAEDHRELEPQPPAATGRLTNASLLLALSTLESDDDQIVRCIGDWLAARGLPALAPLWTLDGCYGADKYMEAPIAIASFAELPVDEFIEYLRTVPWDEPQWLQVMLRRSHEDRWHILAPFAERPGRFVQSD